MHRSTGPATGGVGSSSSSSKWKTREIAALDFLLGIPLENERSIVRSGLENAGDNDNVETTAGERDAFNYNEGNGSKILSALEGEAKAEEEETTKLNVQQQQLQQRWWEKLILKDKGFFSAEDQRAKERARLELETGVLERPTSENNKDGTADDIATNNKKKNVNQDSQSSTAHFLNPTAAATSKENFYIPAPGRRLEGLDATLISIPRENKQTELKTRHRTVARQAEVRQWEVRVAHGLGHTNTTNHNNAKTNAILPSGGLLDGRSFFSSKSSYPLHVFSVIKYQPKKEEAARRRKKLEELGGGGMHFVIPGRDWRGVSYRALLLPNGGRRRRDVEGIMEVDWRGRRRKKRKKRKSLSVGSFTKNEGRARDREDNDDEESSSISSTTSSMSSSDESKASYLPGFLDDPEMVQGRHRHVMVGDRVTGCVVTSTIQFVRPADLKADLNKQFKERFDGWEPPKSQRKYIGATVVNGVYTPMEPTEATHQQDAMIIEPTETPTKKISKDDDGAHSHHKQQQQSEMETIRIYMPPSLTLSKIRSVKQRALIACVRAKLEVSTMALACVYFERLCLDCRVDKSNRRLSFASCLLLAVKINEANVGIVHDPTTKNNGAAKSNNKEGNGSSMKSWIRMTKKHNTIFASLLEFFTQEWSLSLKSLFAAEWGVFAALGFSLHTTPSQVAFHFKRLMKALEWSPLTYLGQEMYDQWQDSLSNEVLRKEEKKKMREIRQKKKEQKLMSKLQQMEEVAPSMRSKTNLFPPVDQSFVVRREGESDKEVDNDNVKDVSKQETSTRVVAIQHGGNSATSTHPKFEKHQRIGSSLRIFRNMSLKKNLSASIGVSELSTEKNTSKLRMSSSSQSLSMLQSKGLLRSASSPDIPKGLSNKDGDGVVINVNGNASWSDDDEAKVLEKAFQ